MRLIIDTNIWVSAAFSLKMRDSLLPLIKDETITILGHVELLAELKAVLSRPKFANLLTSKNTEAYLEMIRERMDFVEFKSALQVCRDEEDNYLLALALDNDANFLLTGDNDLLVLDPFGKTRVITIVQFEALRYPRSLPDI